MIKNVKIRWKMLIIIILAQSQNVPDIPKAYHSLYQIWKTCSRHVRNITKRCKNQTTLTASSPMVHCHCIHVKTIRPGMSEKSLSRWAEWMHRWMDTAHFMIPLRWERVGDDNDPYRQCNNFGVCPFLGNNATEKGKFFLLFELLSFPTNLLLSVTVWDNPPPNPPSWI